MWNSSVTTNCHNMEEATFSQAVNGVPGYPTVNQTLCPFGQLRILTASQGFYTYVTPIVFTVGIIGNILSLMVFMSRNMRKLSASTYLAALSISDTCALVFYVLVDWLRRGLPYLPGQQATTFLEDQGLCQMQTYLSYVSRFVSAWIIATFTVERYIGVCHPLRRKSISGSRSAHKVIVSLIFIACVLMIYKPILTGRYEHSTNYYKVARCSRDPNFPFVSFALDSTFALSITLVPFLLISVLNALIIRRLYLRNKRNLKRYIITEESIIRMEFTVILLVVSFVFITLNLPYFYFWCKRFLHTFNSTVPSRKRAAFLDQSESDLLITRVIFYLNYCVNFFLYSVTGAYFRKEMKLLFCYRRYHQYNGSAFRLSYHSNQSTPQSYV
ncbi:unnamed protein product [Candidula unifasciata]|uniref:G-protein coupled receptors family 1 profile domain-containing protein n=1 Tax=Candidula unifasciata TaxID=100452 RepID=A0A8S3ZV29_9EUPU|nr:unnamed protein product [Candidula unifasciata]